MPIPNILLLLSDSLYELTTKIRFNYMGNLVYEIMFTHV